ncbi:MAG: NAD(P)H-hydrate dehydratase [Methyloprofundus sp.]|nr:NAD(P)H-hydrate dehydratase [Methyloprofundus sp.]
MHQSCTNLYTAQQTREIDRRAQEKLSISGFQLMLKAAEASLQFIKEHYTSVQKITVLCGAGNNAGDGYLLAKLAQQSGYQVTLLSLIDPSHLFGAAALAKEAFIQSSGKISLTLNILQLETDLFVDALLGTGLSRAVSGVFLQAIEEINQSIVPVFSLDIPSGLNADTGDIMGGAIQADKTLSFIVYKQGLMTALAADYVGQLFLDNLAVSTAIIEETHHTSQVINSVTLIKRERCAHKGNYGHCLVLGGDYQYFGAIQLAAKAALNSGAGLVSVATRKENAHNISMISPELMAYGINDFSALSELLNKVTVLVLGPGLGQKQWGESLWQAAIKLDMPKVIDADALNFLARMPFYSDSWVLTPHPGEAARLLSCSNNDILKDRFKAVEQIQKKYGGVCVLKGAGTLIFDGESLLVNSTGNPGMASGGMGDVLSGMIGGLLAQKYSLKSAAIAGVYCHGLAADKAANKLGERGLRATHVLEQIQSVVN